MSSQSPGAVLYDLNGVPLVGSAGSGSAAILTIQGNASGTPVPVSGTVTAANASVSTTGTAVPASATYVGGQVQTLQSGLTTGDLYPLSMTTAGLLRIDGSNVTQPVTGTGTAGAAAAGVVTIQGIASMTPVQVSQATAANLNATVVGSGNFTVVQPTAASLNATVVGTGTGGAVNVAQATAANLNATVLGSGSAGTPATGVVTIQGITGGTVVPTSVTASDTTTGSTALGALNATISIAVTGQSNAAFQLAAGTLVGTIIPEVSVDGGTTWVSTFFDDPTTSNVASSIVFGSSNTATTRTIVGVGGASNVRVRVSAYSSGTANATMRASFMADPSFLSGGAAGAALPPVITQAGGSVTTSAPTYTNATMNALSLDTAGNLRSLVTGTTAAGSGSSTGLVTVQGNASGTPIPVSGTVTATNASVSTTGSAPPGSATYAGGSVTTSAPAYTTGQMNALSLTTAGLLRIDGVYPVNATTPTTDAVFVAGAVTTAAPSYTTGQMSALSLSTAGNLRVDGSSVTQPVSIAAAVTVAQATAANLNATVVQTTASNLNAAVVGVGTAGTPSGGVLTVQGSASGTPLPISGTFTTDKSSTSAITSVAASITSVTLLSSNANRVSATFTNDSTSQVYIALASSASATAYTIKVLPNDYWEMPISYTGAVSAIWTSAAGNMRITELTP